MLDPITQRQREVPGAGDRVEDYIDYLTTLFAGLLLLEFIDKAHAASV